MKDKLTGWYIRGQMKLWDWKERFLHEEKGASHIVEIIVVIVVVIGIAGIFGSKLTDVIGDIFDKVSEFIKKDPV